MAKQQLTEAKVGKFLSLILGAIFSGKADTITSKVSKDRELAKKIKDVDKSYKELIKYFEGKLGKDVVKGALEKSSKSLKQQGFNV